MTVVQLPEELVALREAIRTFIQREVAPKEAQYAQEITETGTFAALQEEKRALRKRSAAEGYYSLFMPEEAGGGGVGYLGLVLCVEECMRHGLLLAMPGGVLPSVEGPTRILLDVTDPGKGARGGISCFLVDTDTPGFEVGRRQRTMYDEHQAELVFADCRVGADALLGKEGYGFYSAMRWINGGRVSIAAMAIGVAQHLYERMLEYAKVREAFGRRIGANQYVQGMVVDTLAELTQARLLVYDLAASLDAGADGRQEAAMAKYVATEMVGRVADRAIQVFGGNGYMTEMGVERWARFVRAMRLYEGTSEILKTNIAKTLGLDEPTRAPAG